jgi:hypothetical protein
MGDNPIAVNNNNNNNNNKLNQRDAIFIQFIESQGAVKLQPCHS